MWLKHKCSARLCLLNSPLYALLFLRRSLLFDLREVFENLSIAFSCSPAPPCSLHDNRHHTDPSTKQIAKKRKQSATSLLCTPDWPRSSRPHGFYPNHNQVRYLYAGKLASDRRVVVRTCIIGEARLLGAETCIMNEHTSHTSAT
jgi:hypothetical protein